MIRPSDKKLITAALGKKYSGLVLEYLAKKSIVNQKTQLPYTASHIREIVNGGAENITIENAIIALTNITKKKKAKDEAKRKQLLRK